MQEDTDLRQSFRQPRTLSCSVIRGGYHHRRSKPADAASMRRHRARRPAKAVVSAWTKADRPSVIAIVPSLDAWIHYPLDGILSAEIPRKTSVKRDAQGHVQAMKRPGYSMPPASFEGIRSCTVKTKAIRVAVADPTMMRRGLNTDRSRHDRLQHDPFRGLPLPHARARFRREIPVDRPWGMKKGLSRSVAERGTPPERKPAGGGDSGNEKPCRRRPSRHYSKVRSGCMPST